ncbi:MULTISPECIES: alpha/beta hydrolase [unclassified Pseudomonas]|uniref:alpha/beta hydrolase n=1 Tax=unclassified Pseudomonas TaxID=196821 RepID=UPI0012962C9B|nr:MULTISPECIES: alpha/beta hydrolase [unclassified Pseudomonas]MDU7558824.1 alpha/beta hydrolase [Pseudomonas sp.]MQT42167.1 alpha/beta fold hydrolase [Pseudomonas sp. FSL R10-0765]MQT53880.1 alpha/beta fold hydrolase [Pseudomonas sp. FSL R10-2398]MQU03713.1 alpha/beta fold hydrolase [Pseudomonas sp. FSL R10-2245]MQU14325.1 alpha/beta fold hydrolase [Pseudomonas sp. FSL R10-2189]
MKTLAALCLLLALSGCSSLLFYPEPGQPITPTAAGLAYKDVNLTAADGTQLHGWWLPAKPGVPLKGTVLHLHGNGGNLAYHLGAVAWLPEQGYQVLMLDYRGYGLSQGKPGLPAVYQDIDAAFDWLEQQPSVQGQPLIVLGQSLGGAMGVHYLSQHPQQRARLKAVVLDGVPASYREVGQFALSTSWLTWPLQVPLSWLVPDADSAVYAMPDMKDVPVLIFHSMDDPIVPLSNGIRLYQAAPPPKVLQLTRGGHVQTFGDPTWRQVMLRYLEDPQHFNGVRRLGEIPNYPPTKAPETETPQ